jgi:hypothetical protein
MGRTATVLMYSHSTVQRSAQSTEAQDVPQEHLWEDDRLRMLGWDLRKRRTRWLDKCLNQDESFFLRNGEIS